jgi:quinone-modifying oxidoreductase subunit QmoB
MGACPVRVISFENYSVDTVGSQVKAVEIPEEDEEKPRILVLACENDAYPALDMAGMARMTYSAWVRVIPVRCLGSVNTIWITDALNSGYDGVMMMGCKKGDDYQCHFVKGSELAHYRMSKIGDTLKQMGLEPERVVTQEVAITDNARVVKLINDYVAELDKLGPSPMKGLRLMTTHPPSTATTSSRKSRPTSKKATWSRCACSAASAPAPARSARTGNIRRRRSS